jgi:N-Acetylglucosaminyltransferase-IV (GnT-IV) conserved region
VVAARGYLTRVFEAMATADALPAAPPVISVCGMGYIGKLVRGGERLLTLAHMLRVFHADMPCDWLYLQ